MDRLSFDPKRTRSVRKQHYAAFSKLTPLERLRYSLDVGLSIRGLLTGERLVIYEKMRHGGKRRFREMGGTTQGSRRQ
jgi:hypothetical protein